MKHWESQKPTDVKHVDMTNKNGDNHMPIKTREYHYQRPDGSNVVLQEHSAGHAQFTGSAAKLHVNVRLPVGSVVLERLSSIR